MVKIAQRPAITLFCFMLCLIYKAEWLVAKVFPEILEHVPAFVHLRLYLRPANCYKSTELMSRSNLGYIGYRIG